MTATLIESIKKSARSFVDLIKILGLGLAAGLLLVLPWLLRIAAFLVWLIGGYCALIAVQTAYAPFSQHGEILALQFAAITSMVAIAMLLMMANREYLWGGLTLGGALFLLASYSVIKLANTEYGSLVLKVLPSALLATSMIVMSIRLKSMRTGGKTIQTSTPLFTWIRKFSKGGGAHSD